MKTASFSRQRTPALLALLCLTATLAARPFFSHFEELAADKSFRLRYDLRKSGVLPAGGAGARLDGVPDDLCLIGIDDQTLLVYGRYGSGDQWEVRKPFRQLLLVLPQYRPSTVAFDILFSPSSGRNAVAADRAQDFPALRRLCKTLAARPEEEFAATDDELLRLTHFAAAQAENDLASRLLLLSQPPPGDATPAVPVISAYGFQGRTLGSNPGHFSPADIFGPEPKHPDEKNGETIPYLLDVAIPSANLRNVPDDYDYATNATLPSQVIRDSVQHGYINVPRDSDGLIRRVPLVFGFTYNAKPKRRAFVPSLALLCVMNHLKLKPADVRVTFGGSIRLTPPAPGRPIHIPIDRQGRMYLNYAGRLGDFHNVSMAYLIQEGLAARKTRPAATAGAVPAPSGLERLIRGKICLVGLTGTGTTDIGPCPIDANTPYVHIHMTAIGNILSGRFLPPPSPWRDVAILTALTLLGFLVCLTERVGRLIAGGVGLLAGYLTLAFALFCHDLVLLPLIAPGACLAAFFLSVFTYRYLTEVRERKRIRAKFATAVSPQVLRFMEEHPQQALAGQRVEATVMFSDVANFTSISECLAPEQLTRMLNEYFNAMTDIILDPRDDAYLDKFVGDAIMAVWGVPYTKAGHELVACRSALRQREAILGLCPHFRKKYGIEFSVRIGVNSGPVVAGEMGSLRKSQYTVMGDTVNQASRFEPANKDYGTGIIIGEGTRERIGDAFIVRLLDTVIVTGKTQPVSIYELVAEADTPLPEERRKAIALYEKALRLHWGRNWDEAEALLQQALILTPHDLACANLRQRIAKYREAPLPAGWLGEFIRASKH